MNMFGQTLNGIVDTILDIEAWLDEQVTSYTDFDGGRIDLPLTDEQQHAEERLTQLRELMDLRKPVSDDWALDMYFGQCPCGPDRGPAESLSDWHY